MWRRVRGCDVAFCISSLHRVLIRLVQRFGDRGVVGEVGLYCRESHQKVIYLDERTHAQPSSLFKIMILV